MPRWLGVSGYVFAAVLFLATDFSRAVAFLFPLWILIFSIDSLVHRASSAGPGIDAAHPTTPNVLGGPA